MFFVGVLLEWVEAQKYGSLESYGQSLKKNDQYEKYVPRVGH